MSFNPFRADVEPGPCGDFPLSRAERRRFLWGNLAANIGGALAPLPLSRFRPSGKSKPMEATPSPMRLLVDAYLVEGLPALIGPARPISVLDIGGGSGYVRQALAEAGYSGEYVCVDAAADSEFAECETPAFRASQIVAPFESFDAGRTFDLVLSVTSLEHVKDVGATLTNAQRHRAPGGVELHVVPGGWSLPCYIWHGYRQFSRGRIRVAFGSRGEGYQVVALGGLGSLLLQFLGVTVPERWLRRRLRGRPLYARLTRWAARLDRWAPVAPLAYAVVSPTRTPRR